jgi:hypothetical protein
MSLWRFAAHFHFLVRDFFRPRSGQKWANGAKSNSEVGLFLRNILSKWLPDLWAMAPKHFSAPFFAS